MSLGGLEVLWAAKGSSDHQVIDAIVCIHRFHRMYAYTCSVYTHVHTLHCTVYAVTECTVASDRCHRTHTAHAHTHILTTLCKQSRVYCHSVATSGAGQ
jgi:hypothetical protein